MNILIVDDNEGARRLLQIYLAGYGTLTTANNGFEAVEVFSHAVETNKRFDLVCLDNAMPRMNGIDTLKKMREIERTHKVSRSDQASIFIISAIDESSEIEKAYENGGNAYIVRPHSKSKLIEEMHHAGLLPHAAA